MAKRKISYDAAQEIAREMVRSKSVMAHIMPQLNGKLQVAFFVYLDAEEEVVETEFPIAVGE